MRARGFFITGTDTGIGKTWTAVALMRHLQGLGKSVAAMKPVAAGCRWVQGAPRNEDALLLQANASAPVSYEAVNPFAFDSPIAPQLAAAREGRTICFDLIEQCFRELLSCADLVLVEGIGGWEVPLDEKRTVADLAARLALPVILVVGIRLGCLNHAILTWNAIRRSAVPCAGWVANCLDSTCLAIEENIHTLAMRFDTPPLAVLPAMPSPDFSVLASCFRPAKTGSWL